MKKFILLFMIFILCQNFVNAQDTIQFNFPNNGWHKTECGDNNSNKQCYVPVNQNGSNYTEMLTLYERVIKTQGITSVVIMQKQLGKDRNNYPDIVPEYIKQEIDDTMAAWCSRMKNTCSLTRVFQGNQGVIIATYINKMPHYSQNIFGQWSNILGSIKLYEQSDKEETKPDNLIEL